MDKNSKIVIILLLILILISLLTKYYGSIDIEEYASVAKYFSGSYNAKIRVSHSLLYGLIHSPLISIFKSLIVMKITTLLFLLLIIFSLYYITKKDKRFLLLLILSPIIWYTASWITPIALSSLLFLWAYYFLSKYDKNQEYKLLIYSGLLLGLSIAFWNTAIFPAFFLLICYFYNRNVNHIFVFLCFSFIGYLPVFLLDLFLYKFPFYSMVKYLLGIFTAVTQGSIYSGVQRASFSLLPVILFLVFIPFFSFNLLKKENFKKNKRAIIFLLLTFLFFLRNPQIRYILFFYPILILSLAKTLSKKQFKIQLIIFIIISLLVINPYLIQIKYTTNFQEFNSLISNLGKWRILENQNKLIMEDLKEIAKEYKNEVFVVGNKPEDYVKLALLSNEAKEFVSIEDYNLYFSNESLFEKKLASNPRIPDRRQIVIIGQLKKTEDNTDYNSINLGIGLGEEIDLENFQLVKKYKVLYLSKKA